MGLRRMVVNHPNFVIEANPAQAREWVELGAVVEHGLVQYDDRTTYFQCNPFPINAYERVLGQLLDAGVSLEDVPKLVAVNTGRVLDV